MRVIGTAGHVDHGKSTLVRALTGTDPDRLKEEKQRQMTIDLGFAFFNLENGEQVGIVDVPGHRDFIENMLAGVGGIDAVLLVIAADEGVMPQTREHLAIIDLLKIEKGIIVLSKIDLVGDPDWFDLVENDIRAILKGTVLENAKIMRVSSTSGEGIEDLKKEIAALLASTRPARDLGRPRLPVDRVFSVQGFGTVVTGTLNGGSLRVGDVAEILVSGRNGRIRGLQAHNSKEEVANPGSRTAVNISGIDADDIKRGDVVSLPGIFQPTRRIDARIKLLSDASTGLRHNDAVKIFLGTAERIGRVRLLGRDVVQPGEFGWVQLEFEPALAVEKGDRFIIRRSSPAETLGGGEVVTPDPAFRYKLNDPSILARLEARFKPSGSEALFNLIEDHKFLKFSEIGSLSTEFTSFSEEDLQNLIEKEQIIPFQGKNDGFYTTREYWRHLTGELEKRLAEYHTKNPLRSGMTAEEIRKRLNLLGEIFRSCIQNWADEGVIQNRKQFIALPDFEIKYSPQQRGKLDALDKQMDQNPFNPPNIAEIRTIIGAEVFQSLLDTEYLIQITADVAFRDIEYQQMVDFVLDTCKEGILLSVGEFRDRFSTSRKFALAFLEHLDQKGITERSGEGRRLKSK